jgi:hypothetical protein
MGGFFSNIKKKNPHKKKSEKIFPPFIFQMDPHWQVKVLWAGNAASRHFPGRKERKVVRLFRSRQALINFAHRRGKSWSGRSFRWWPYKIINRRDGTKLAYSAS